MSNTKINSATLRLMLIMKSNEELSEIFENNEITDTQIQYLENKVKDIKKTQNKCIQYNLINSDIPYMNCNTFTILEYAALPIELFLDEETNNYCNFDMEKYLKTNFKKRSNNLKNNNSNKKIKLSN